VAWEALQDGTAAAVEALTLRIAELETENEALIQWGAFFFFVSGRWI
jgi:hypothetical protein